MGFLTRTRGKRHDARPRRLRFHEALVGCGFRLGDPTLFMASRLFGRPDLYLPSGPILC